MFSELVIDWLIVALIPSEQFYIIRRWWWGPLCTRPTHLVGFL
jgi:hypothetical protein